jgi:hypothetical protein
MFSLLFSRLSFGNCPLISSLIDYEALVELGSTCNCKKMLIGGSCWTLVYDDAQQISTDMAISNLIVPTFSSDSPAHPLKLPLAL